MTSLPWQLRAIQPFQAQRRGRMRAGAKCEARIELDEAWRQRGLAVVELRALSAGADPQPLAEAHGAEVLEPFAFPGAIGDLLEGSVGERLRQLVRSMSSSDWRSTAASNSAWIRTRGHSGVGARQRLQHRIVAGVLAA